jgi:hypothetical protein
MPSIAFTIVLGEKPFHKQQPKAAIVDGKGNTVYTSVITMSAKNFDQIKKELDILADKLIHRYGEFEKSPDLIKTSDQLQSPKEPQHIEIKEALTDTDET